MRNRLFACLLCAFLGAAPTTRTTASTRPSTTKSSVRKSSSEPARSKVRAAMSVLGTEFDQSLRDPTKPARTACNYFKDHPNADVTPEAIAATLIGPNSDPRASAYVKWQLLSGFPEKVEAEMGEQLLVAYRGAPLPIPRPGMSAQDQQKFDQLAQGVKQSDEPVLIEAMEVAVTANRRENAPILAYRDELYRRLPKTGETLAAALEDLLQRVTVAAEGKELVKMLATDAQEWAVTGNPSRSDLAALGKAARRLADTKSPQYYGSVSWRPSDNQFAWRKTRTGIDTSKTLKELAVFLEDQSRQPALDLTIKEKKNQPQN